MEEAHGTSSVEQRSRWKLMTCERSGLASRRQFVSLPKESKTFLESRRARSRTNQLPDPLIKPRRGGCARRRGDLWAFDARFAIGLVRAPFSGEGRECQ